MHDKLLALALLFLFCAAGGGCAMCDPNYPYGPTAGAHGGYYGRAGSVLEPMPYGAIPQVAPSGPIEAGPMELAPMESEPMAVE
jgi:hypothetical protein